LSVPARRRHRRLLIPAAIGILFMLLAAVGAAPDIGFVFGATRAEGRFVGAVTQSGGKASRPMFHYRTADGSIRTFTARGGLGSKTYVDGDKAVILYDPARPGDARLNSFVELWLGPTLLAGCGLLLILLSLALHAAAGRRDDGR
jgi:hypothetical protein